MSRSTRSTLAPLQLDNLVPLSRDASSSPLAPLSTSRKASSPRDLLQAAAAQWEAVNAEDKQNGGKKASSDSMKKSTARRASVEPENYELYHADDKSVFNQFNNRSRAEKFFDLQIALQRLGHKIGELKRQSEESNGLRELVRYRDAIGNMMKGVSDTQTENKKCPGKVYKSENIKSLVCVFRERELPYLTELTWRLMARIDEPNHEKNNSRGRYLVKKLACFMDMKQCMSGVARVFGGAGVLLAGGGGSSAALFYKGSQLFWKSLQDKKSKEIAAEAAGHLFSGEKAYELGTPASRRTTGRRSS
ncbi:MAG TPA: hypothetical protein VLJ15_06795 [Gammaproteobacteria bacterium]|nr:hypothetical protein [Gammaproteobacteria bacterium]